MPTKPAFDNEKYLKEQSSKILERVKQYGDKLYLEFGGKLLYDFHAARVLPGYEPNLKMKLLQQLNNVGHVPMVEKPEESANIFFKISWKEWILKLITQK